MYTINHMWVANFGIENKIPEGRSKIYGLYKTIDDAIIGLEEWLMKIPHNGCDIMRVTETLVMFLSPDGKTRGYVEIQKIKDV